MKTVDARGIEIKPYTGDYGIFNGSDWVTIQALREEHHQFLIQYFIKLFGDKDFQEKKK